MDIAVDGRSSAASPISTSVAEKTTQVTKRRILTEARRLQNRKAQQIYRQRQRELKGTGRPKGARRVSLKKRILRPRSQLEDSEAMLLLDNQRLDYCQAARKGSPTVSYHACSGIANLSASFQPPTLPDPFINAMEFLPTTIYSATLQNALFLGFDLARLAKCSAEYQSPFYRRSLFAQGGCSSSVTTEISRQQHAEISTIPLHLQPTSAQISIPHDACLDVIPIPYLRDRAIMLSAAMPHLYNLYELKVDIYTRGGLTVWRRAPASSDSSRPGSRAFPPWDMGAWEASPWFIAKWSMALDGENGDFAQQSLAWRALRDSQSIATSTASSR